METLARNPAAGLEGVNLTTLTPVVRRALLSESVEVGDWRVEVVKRGRGGATGGVYRVNGTGQEGPRKIAWSLVLKVVRCGESAMSRYYNDEAHELYWKREALAYRSNLLDNLPGGLEAAHCYGVVEQPNGSIWLWLEDAKESHAREWPLEQYARTAQALGRFNGAYLVERPMPLFPWLVRNGSPRGLMQGNFRFREVIADHRNWEHPMVRAAFPLPVAERLLRLWEDRGALLDALDRAPHTLCHHDAWRGNIFAPVDANGDHRLVLIDWAFVGSGAAGIDAGDLFGGSFSMFGVEPVAPSVLDKVIFDSYLDGLNKAGWRGDKNAVRLVFTTLAALKYAAIPFWLSHVQDEATHSIWEQHSGRPMDEFIHRQAILTYHLLDLADEAGHLV